MKSRTNVTIRRVLLDEAKERGVSLSPLFEAALEKRLKELAAAEWIDANRDRINGYNDFVAEHGTFSDSYRSF